MLKLTNLVAIGIFIIVAIILIKYRPVYSVSVDGEQIGYVGDKKGFEEYIITKLYNNEEENIAYSELTSTPKYELALVDKQEDTKEEVVFAKIKENSQITYYQYAIAKDGENKEYVNTLKEAEEVVNTLKSEFGEDNANISIVKVYTNDKETMNSVEVATISNNLRTILQQDKDEKAKEEAKKQANMLNGVSIAMTPVKGRISSRYGSNSTVRNHTHMGVDIAATTGTPIKAVASGTVTVSGTSGGYGKLIVINHGNGVETYYGHCSKLYKSVGTWVEAGEVIAAVGSTGNSTGPHLHYEIRVNGKYVNPQKYLK